MAGSAGWRARYTTITAYVSREDKARLAALAERKRRERGREVHVSAVIAELLHGALARLEAEPGAGPMIDESRD